MFLGIDVGTSSVKVAAVGEDAAVLDLAERSYPLHAPRPGWAEQDPDDWWRATVAATRELGSRVDLRSVRAVGLSGQMHTLVMVDDEGRPTRSAISWADARSQAEVGRYVEELTPDERVNVLGNPPATGFTGPSLLWVARHEADVYRATSRIGLAKDFVRARLMGRWATDPSDASATLLFDPFRRDWAWEIVGRLGLDPSLLPDLLPSDGVAGVLLPAAAEALGLPAEVPVVTGASDQAAAACGCGLVRPGSFLATLGSGGQVFAPLQRPAADPRLRVHLFCHARPDLWHLEGAVLNAGLALDWVRSTFGWAWDELYARADRAPAGARDVTFVPHLTGERTPYMDPSARASWSGLSLSHGPDDLARAALEGVVYGVAEAVLACEEAAGAPEVIAVAGGGARNRAARRILADVVGRPLARAEVQHASVRGAAVLAGAGVPAFRSTPDVEPGPDAEAHRDGLARQRRAYEALRRA